MWDHCAISCDDVDNGGQIGEGSADYSLYIFHLIFVTIWKKKNICDVKFGNFVPLDHEYLLRAYTP